MASAGTNVGATRMQRFINSETGPKTIHFWAPVMKWALVFAGINDLQRPVEKISGTQQIALFATGAIWTRWCLIIKPKNYFLASVNFFLGAVAGFQLIRLVKYQRTLGYSYGGAISNVVQGKKIEETIADAPQQPANASVAAAIAASEASK